VTQVVGDDGDEVPEDVRLRLVDELGDIMWYVTFGCGNVVELTLDSMIDKSIAMAQSSRPGLDLEAMYAVLMGECGEVADTVKKLLYHGKPYDDKSKGRMANALREIVDSVQMIAQSVCGVTLQDVINKNVEKLSDRYKGLQFSTEEFMKKEEAKGE
jgi:NTP pyrophosphatase (non-canonical NTP hydrolase)